MEINKQWYEKRIGGLERDLYLAQERVNIELNSATQLQKDVLEFLKDKVSAEILYDVETIFIEQNFRGS